MSWSQLINVFSRKVQIDDLVIGPADLAIPQQLCEHWAEALVMNLVDVCEFSPCKYSGGLTLSDGSMILAAAGILDDKLVTKAAIGSKSLALKVLGYNVSILHGELVGLIVSLILAENNVTDNLMIILINHLNSVRLVDDI